MHDNHHEIVSRRVEEVRAAGGGAPRLYFGWSSILDADAFAEWKASHGHDLPLANGRLARLPDHGIAWNLLSRYWGGRVPGIVPVSMTTASEAAVSGREVWGLLWEVRAEDWPILEHKEGAVTGISVPVHVRVEANGAFHEAVAFTTNPERATAQGPISDNFRAAWLRGARAAGLPETYLAEAASSG